MSENIIEIAKTKTKEDFFNGEIITEDCPGEYGLKDNKEFCGYENGEYNCKECWKQVIEAVGIEFNDEKLENGFEDNIDIKIIGHRNHALVIKSEEVIEQPKEYTIHNLLNDFPSETEFVNCAGTKYRIQDGDLRYYNSSAKEWRLKFTSYKQILEMKFTKVEDPKLKPMTFKEAVRTKKKVKYEYEHPTEDSSGELTTVKWKQDNFYSPNETIQSITECFPSHISDIILNGTWFAEGVYE